VNSQRITGLKKDDLFPESMAQKTCGVKQTDFFNFSILIA